jgi:NAD(P)-dependent dehydrogenase (short-subunit alcohol dehydrogenase family)
MISAERPVVLVTGAGGQIGSAIARATLARGAAVVLVDRDGVALERSASGLDRASVDVIELDITDRAQVGRLLPRVLESAGRLDGLVNNAGVEGPVGPIEKIPLDEVRRVFEVNLFALLAVTQSVLPHFRNQGAGRIVNIASGAGLAGSGYMAAYSSSKHAVIGLTRSIAQEAAAAGIVVNAVCPGCVESPMMDRIEERLGTLRGAPVSFVPSIPMGRYARPDEVGDLVAYLALEAPVYVTGAAIVIDGALRA